MPRFLACYGHLFKPRELHFRVPREKLDLETSIELDPILRGCPDPQECRVVSYHCTGSRKSIKFFCARPRKPILSFFDSFIRALKKYVSLSLCWFPFCRNWARGDPALNRLTEQSKKKLGVYY